LEENKSDTIEEVELRYFINLKWHEESNRSFRILARSRMCPTCQAKLRTGPDENAGSKPTDIDILQSIHDCCAQAADFFTPYQPIQESVFRLFLSNGNQSLTANEICRQLEKLRGQSPDSLSPEKLRRVLEHDRYYGLRPASRNNA
jgi:hypothetical protein